MRIVCRASCGGPVGGVHYLRPDFYFYTVLCQKNAEKNAKKKPQTGGLGARCLRCVLRTATFATVFLLDEWSESGVLLGCPTSRLKCLGLVCRMCSVTR